MIDPLVSLAFSLESNKGAYALLIGSGISRPAGIPTGWEITLEMVRKVAATSGEQIEVSPEDWFREAYSKDPDYSELLDQLCKSPAERQQYLKPFFEPSTAEREEGLKQPTVAHQAIADMMAEGYIRVVVTTNFDRLLEQALEAKGIVPVVIANADQASGMLPLVHQKHCIIKVHGDYLDTRIMNTEAELSSYSSEMNKLLDRVFDEFGIVICGWSGAWDPALRSAIVRAPSRRFSSYWATRGELGGDAKKTAADRGIVVLPIVEADSFFRQLSDNLDSLREFNKPHPLSVQTAVATLKRYLAEDRYRIRLHDLLVSAVDDARFRWAAAGVDYGPPEPTDATVPIRVKTYDAGLDVLLPMGVELGKWAKSEHHALICEVLEILCLRSPTQGSYFSLWRSLARYPATSFLYSVGLSALKADHIELIGRMLSVPITGGREEDEPAVSALMPFCLVETRESLWPLFAGQRRHTPLNDWLETRMRTHFAPNTSSDEYHDPFTQLFDQFEVISAVAYRALVRQKRAHIWVPIGCWGWRRSAKTGILEGLGSDLAELNASSKLMRLGLFGSVEEAKEVLAEVIQFAGEVRMW